MSAGAFPSGAQYDIAAGGYEATVVEVGGGLRELRFQGRPVLDGYVASEMCHGARGQPLIPWPNRLDHGRYRFDGHDQQVALTEPERSNAIHGFTRWANWHPVEQAADRVTMGHRLHGQPGWTHVLDLTIDYHLAADGLTVTVTATNVGATAAPYGNGAHPYLTVGADRIDSCQLHLPVDVHIVVDERGIPTGREKVAGTQLDFRSPRPLGGLAIDDAFTGLQRDSDGRARVSLIGPAGTQASLWMDEAYPWVEVFTGDHLPRPDKRRTGLGVEPMSCPPNAFVSGKDLIRLEPRQSTSGTWGITARTK
ncbi:MAG TPA: aldose 1-epimerase family protein [Acidimicrobiales bacterium]|jgi:aldose 1-epimerase|nr:aldose 1-epimerase family protein [Acidimicrobiales bacterium]